MDDTGSSCVLPDIIGSAVMLVQAAAYPAPAAGKLSTFYVKLIYSGENLKKCER